MPHQITLLRYAIHVYQYAIYADSIQRTRRPRRRLARRHSSSKARSQRYGIRQRPQKNRNTNVGAQKKKVASGRAQDQKAIDKALLSSIKKEKYLASYLATSFSLRNGQKPHEMKF